MLSPASDSTSDSAAAAPRRRPRVVLVASALAGLAVAVAGLLLWRRHPYVFDDAYISYRYAFNLVHGHGLVYNVGDRVEGYTNFLWVLLAALGLERGIDPLRITVATGVAAYLGAALVGAAAVATVAARTTPRALVALLFLPALILPDGLAGVAGSGLETSFVALLVLLTGLTQHLWVPRSTAGQLAASLLPAAALLTRLDAAPFVACSALVVVDSEWQAQRSVRAVALVLLRRFGPAALLVLVWLAWKIHYYGDFWPNTYYAKNANLSNLRAGTAFLLAFLESYPHTALLLPLLPLATWLGRPRFSAFHVWALSSLLLHMIYVVRVGGDFMHYRFMFQAYPTLAVAAAIALAQLAARTPRSAVIAGAGALALAAISFGRVQLESRFYMQSLREMDDYTTVGRRVGEALERALPPDTVIATTLAGTIAYYSELETIDQWGLNDRFIAHQDLVNRRSRGHVKRAPDSYLRSRHTNLHFWHPVVCSCTHPCNESVPNVFIRLAPLERDECVRSWYMTPTPALTAHLCAHPEQFVLNQIACPAAPSR